MSVRPLPFCFRFPVARWSAGFLGVLLLLLLTGCGGSSADGGEATYRIAVVSGAGDAAFWAEVRAGAEAAAADLGDTTIEWMAPASEEDVDGQLSALEAATKAGMDALVVAPLDPEALVQALEAAGEHGIPVVTIQARTEPAVGVTHIAIDEREVGRQAAELLAAALGGEGRVALLSFTGTTSTALEREEGFREGLARHPGLTLVAMQYAGRDVAAAAGVTEDILMARPDLDGLFATDGPATRGAARTLHSRDLQDQVALVGVDASPEARDDLHAGLLYGLIVPDAFEVGYQSIRQALRARRGEAVPDHIHCGLTVLTRDHPVAARPERRLQPIS
ncbi:hypothetical protein AWN76_002965 [Rhodothermaceae bacterium RA]|nr:hypothetical protein AWN76_002965 [Rhodothermaceae bacterium RA]